MKERPILFSGPMIRALLAGTKTQTRRIVKPQPKNRLVYALDWYDADGVHPGVKVKCPYGRGGDLLWVRETFFPRLQNTAAIYRADSPDDGMAEMYGGWKPSIFMPRTLSRLTLEVTNVRAERLHDISEEDAKAEGVSLDGPVGNR